MSTEQPTQNTAEIVTRYIALRDKKAELDAAHKAKVAEYDTAMEKIEQHLLAQLQANEADSMATAAGTFYKSETMSVRVDDWQSTLNFIKAENAWHMLDKRVNKTAVKEFMEAVNDLPPGLSLHREAVVRVRRA